VGFDLPLPIAICSSQDSSSRVHVARRTFSNPVYDEYFADPFVWRYDGAYYAIGTGPKEALGTVGVASGASIFPLLKSADLSSWTALGSALVRPEAGLGDSFWAPEITRQGSLWYLYYSVGYGDACHQLRVASSESVIGPYLDSGLALTDLRECPFAIDPHPFEDEDGRRYLFYARDFLSTADDSGETVRAGTALVVRELETMTQLGTAEKTVLRAKRDWQRFLAERTMYGRVFDWHTLEGPCVERHAGRYYCFFSGGRWETPNYGVDYAVAEGVLGPWSDAGNEAGPRVLRTAPGRVLGPGHNSIVVGPDGVTRYIVYHAWDSAMQARRMCIDELIWTEQGPRARGPTWTPQPLCHDASSHAP